MNGKKDRRYRLAIPDIEYYRKLIKCTTACPINTPAGRYVQAVGRGDYETAYNLARRTNPLVYVCARVCAHPCEDACRRKFIDEPVAINALKRVATDHHNLGLGHNTGMKIPSSRNFKEKVAVIGSGPAGLSCAHDLALLGYKVTIFESRNTPGGMLALGIPVYRLPRDVLKLEIDAILSLGIELKTNATLGRDFTLQDLRKHGYKAVFLAVGAHRSRELNIEGSDLDGVMKGVEFLLNVNLGYKVSVGKKVVVIGGGNVAIDVARSVTRESMAKASATEDGSATMDAARTALRIGAEEVHVVCLESREEMPAFEYEVEEAEKEGIILHPSRGPKRIIGEDGRVAALETIRCSSVFDEDGRFNPKFEEHTETVLPADSVIMAIGQRADLSFIQPADGIDVTPHDTIRVNPETLATTAPGVFAGGDVAFGPRIIVDAIADGQKAARSIHLFLREEKIHVESKARMVPLENHSMPPEYLSIPRETMPSIPIKKRLGIAEVQLGFSESQAANEGKRCLKCNINTIFDGKKCILCGGCVDVCPEYCLKMIDLGEAEIDENMRRLIERKLEVDLENGRVLEEREFRKLGTLMIKDEERCIRCGLCARRCPTGAVTMESFEYVEEYVG